MEVQNEHFWNILNKCKYGFDAYSFDLGYIIIISCREKVQRLKLAGYCPWTILLNLCLCIYVIADAQNDENGSVRIENSH